MKNVQHDGFILMMDWFCIILRNSWNYTIVTDIGSGLNYHKKGLLDLIKRIETNQVERIVLNYKDRLLRFGSEIISTVKDYVFSRYSGINSLHLLDSHRKDVRDVWVDTKFAEQWHLPARYWKNALDETFANIKTEWANTKNRIKAAVKQNVDVTEDERTFIYYIKK